MFALVLSAFSGTKAHAGLISLLGDLVAGRAEAGVQDGRVLNSASLSLLEAPLSPDPKEAVGGPELNISDGTFVAALSPNPDAAAGFGGVISSDQISTYTVREGDTLSEIAEMFDVDVSTIRWANGIKYNNVIGVGQKLTILPVTGVKYKVQKRDTLASIAKEYKGDAQEIADYNKISLDANLVVGEEIIIPNGVLHTPAPRVASARSRVADTAGYFVRPMNGVRTQGLHGNNGIDIGAPTGTSVRAAASGEVILAKSSGYNGGYGLYIVISHGNGTQTLYAHLSQVNVRVGDWITKGSNIGRSGNTGRSTGPHLHFEVRGGHNPF